MIFLFGATLDGAAMNPWRWLGPGAAACTVFRFFFAFFLHFLYVVNDGRVLFCLVALFCSSPALLPLSLPLSLSLSPISGRSQVYISFAQAWSVLYVLLTASLSLLPLSHGPWQPSPPARSRAAGGSTWSARRPASSSATLSTASSTPGSPSTASDDRKDRSPMARG